MYIVVGYFVLLNLLGVVMMGIDKKRSQKGQWRIPEMRFWTIGLFGGGLGLYWGMRHYHHKTKHKTFTIGVPVIMIVNLVLYGMILYTINIR